MMVTFSKIEMHRDVRIENSISGLMRCEDMKTNGES